MNIAALTTCHNRRELTKRSLESLKNSTCYCSHIKIDYYLLDDNSTDGTYEMIKDEHPDVYLSLGNGNLFWNRGMASIWKQALAHKEYDAYLLYNDDIFFYYNAIKDLVYTFQYIKTLYNEPTAIIGSLIDPQTNNVSYGGLKAVKRLNPIKFNLVIPRNEIVSCDTFNMNCALIEKKAVEKIGILDEYFHHSFGDLDYGLRLKKANGKIYVAPKYLGECERNPIKNTWLDKSLGRVRRLKKMMDIKGIPLKERLHFCKRHGGILWPILWIAPYLVIVIFNITKSGERHKY